MGWTITLVAGLALLLLAGTLGLREHQWIKNAGISDGKVVELVAETSHRRHKHRTTYKPRVTFIAEDGQQYTFTRKTASNPPGYHVGEVVKVAYDRANHEGRILSFGERFGVPIVLATVGLCALLMSLAFILGRACFFRIYLQ